MSVEPCRFIVSLEPCRFIVAPVLKVNVVPCLRLSVLQRVAQYDQDSTQTKTEWSLMVSGTAQTLEDFEKFRQSRCWAVLKGVEREEDLRAFFRWFVATFGDEMDDRILAVPVHPSREQFIEALENCSPQEHALVERVWVHVHELGGVNVEWDANASVEALQAFVIHLENNFCFPNVLRRVLNNNFCVARARKKRKKSKKAAPVEDDEEEQEIQREMAARGMKGAGERKKSKRAGKPKKNSKYQGVDYTEEKKEEASEMPARVSHMVKKDITLADGRCMAHLGNKREFFFKMLRVCLSCHLQDTWNEGVPMYWEENCKVCLRFWPSKRKVWIGDRVCKES